MRGPLPADTWDLGAVAQAAAGEEPWPSRLIDTLTPVIQSRVARVLLRGQQRHPGRIRPLVEDLTQEVFMVLFARGGRVLRDWQPDRGLSLANFVGLVAERQTVSYLRSGRRSGWREDPTLTDTFDAATADPSPERWAASRQQMERLLERLTEELSPLGRQLFRLLYLEERGVEEVEGLTGMSSDAVYAWRSRLRRRARRVLQEGS